MIKQSQQKLYIGQERAAASSTQESQENKSLTAASQYSPKTASGASKVRATTTGHTS